MQIRRSGPLAICFAPLISISGTTFADQLSLPAADLEAPSVTHETSSKAHEAGTDLTIEATVVDNMGVKSVTLYYRAKGTEKYKTMVMQRRAKSDIYSATLTHDVSEPGFEYYIQATDNSGNSLLHGYSFSPLLVDVVPAPARKTADADVEPKPVDSSHKRSFNPGNWYALPEIAFFTSKLSGTTSGSWNTTGVIVRAGKRLLPFLAVEGVVGAGIADFDRTNGCYRETFSNDTVLGANLKGIFNVQADFELTGSIGLFQGSATLISDRSNCATPSYSEEKSSQFGLGLGAGAEYRLNRFATLHGAYNLYYQGELLNSDLQVSGFSLGYKHQF
ncbi:MAG: porin family protein [Gammaproteobacteria bacterium]|nr:porin family protein [Gammaproteobacteria bacterium]MDH5802390.1 porin family protein [Gammaproteobacteria bacterium]